MSPKTTGQRKEQRPRPAPAGKRGPRSSKGDSATAAAKRGPRPAKGDAATAPKRGPRPAAKDSTGAVAQRARRPAAGKADIVAGQALAFLSRIQIRRVWESAQVDEPPQGGESRQAAVMREHPDGGDPWARLDEVSDDDLEQGKPEALLHMTYHLIVENQLADDDPPEVRHALQGLMTHGLSRHDAIHHIAALYSAELRPVLAKKREFDTPGYARRLRQLAK